MAGWSDETLMAYVDGELDAPMRTAIDAARAGDPALARRIDAQRALRERIAAEFDPVLDEPVPHRLTAALARRPPADVVDLGAARDRRPAALPVRRWRWPEWGAMAACLVAGVFAGRLVPDAATGGSALQVGEGGALVAGGALDAALAGPSSDREAAPHAVSVGSSFVAKSGGYCRVFSLPGDAATGLACRQGRQWRIEVLARGDPPAGPDAGYRQAGSPLPEAVGRGIEQHTVGDALDAKAERDAAARGWQR